MTNRFQRREIAWKKIIGVRIAPGEQVRIEAENLNHESENRESGT